MASGFGDMGSLLKQAQEMQKRIADTERDLEGREVEGSAGGGAVVVRFNGNQRLVSVKLDPECVDPEDVEGLEELLTIAIKQAVEASHELRKREMERVTGGLGLPGMGF